MGEQMDSSVALVGAARERHANPLSAAGAVRECRGRGRLLRGRRHRRCWSCRGSRMRIPLLIALLLGLYAVVSRIEFEIGNGYADPEQLVFVPMLFLAPLAARAAARRRRLRARPRPRADRPRERGHRCLGPRRTRGSRSARCWVLATLAPSGPPIARLASDLPARARSPGRCAAPQRSMVARPGSTGTASRIVAGSLWACARRRGPLPRRASRRARGRANEPARAARRRPARLAAARLLAGAQGALRRLARAAERLPRHGDAALRRRRGRGRLHRRSTAARSSSWSPRSRRSWTSRRPTARSSSSPRCSTTSARSRSRRRS